MNTVRSMGEQIAGRSAGVAFIAAAALVLLLGVEIKAQPVAGEPQTMQGTVRSLTTAPRGEVDGAVLEDGTVIHWPPHLEDRFRDLAARGERIRVTGRMETGPRGDTHFEVRSLTNVRTKTTRENDDGPPPPPPPGRSGRPGPRGPRERDRFARAEAKTVEGKVRSLTTAPRGEIDGAVLEDGTVIHWPPHLEDRFGDLAARGERIRVTGRMETGPEGDTHLEVESLTNLRTKATRENDDGPPPPPPERRGAAPDRPRDREQRLRQLEEQMEQMRREIERLRREG
jgi:hypothetical protein